MEYLIHNAGSKSPRKSIRPCDIFQQNNICNTTEFDEQFSRFHSLRNLLPTELQLQRINKSNLTHDPSDPSVI